MHTGCSPHTPTALKTLKVGCLRLWRCWGFVFSFFLHIVYNKKKSNFAGCGFLSISCAFTVCKFVGSLLPRYDLVIHPPPPPPPWPPYSFTAQCCTEILHLLKRQFTLKSENVISPPDHEAPHSSPIPNPIPCYVWSHCGIVVLCNNAELNTTTAGEGWRVLPAANLPYLETSVGRTSSHPTAQEISAL